MAPSPRTARASGRARRGRARAAVRAGPTGPSRTRRAGASARSLAPSSRALVRAPSLPPLSRAASRAYWPGKGGRGRAAWASVRAGRARPRPRPRPRPGGTLSRCLSAGLDGRDARQPRGWGCGARAGPAAAGCLWRRLSCRCCAGRFGPWHFVSWRRHRTKSPEPWGVPEVDARVHFLSGPTGPLPSGQIPKPARHGTSGPCCLGLGLILPSDLIRIGTGPGGGPLLLLLLWGPGELLTLPRLDYTSDLSAHCKGMGGFRLGPRASDQGQEPSSNGWTAGNGIPKAAVVSRAFQLRLDFVPCSPA
ncbi:hypothetical protein NN561_016813 [Cricetulus griseus]